MDVVETINDLLEDLLSIRFFQSPSLPHIVKEVTTSAELHHNDDVLLSLDGLIDLHHMVMSQLQ